jgi:hypothetical protein
VANPPPDRFDPCRAWLGIDRADLADPRRVLGLVPGETDPIVVLKAAETRLKALKGLAAGQHHAAREALILQVEQAREKVLSQIAAVGKGQALPGPPAQGSGFSMPPPPRRPGVATTDADAGATVVFDDPAGSGAEAEDSFASPVVRVRRYRPGRRQGSAAIWVSLLAILGSVAAGVGFIWWQARQQDLRQAARSQATRSPRDEDLAAGPQGDAGDRSKPLPEDAAISSSPPPSRPEGMKPITPSTTRPAPAVKMPRTTTVAASEPAPETTVTEPMETAAAESQPSLDTVAAMDGDAPEEERMADAGISGEDVTDIPADEEMTSAESTDDDSEIETAISSALSAIRTSDFDTADALLASALEGGRSMPAKRRVSDWQTLAQYAREFAGFREKAISDIKPGDEYDVNGKKVGVVEIDDKKFIYRFQGRNKTTPRNKIPSGIAMAIVTDWFDERPANHLFLGAHHATKPEPDLAKARDQWERAENGGINAEPLLRLLDDPLLQEGAKASEPTDE